MLIGLPASGKSTWAIEYKAKFPEFRFQVVSSDDIIEERGLVDGLDYSASYLKNIDFAIKEMERRFDHHVKGGANIIHDQTNLSIKSRKGHLAKVVGYVRSAIVFSSTESVRNRRFEKRKLETGKIIPSSVIDEMTKRFEHPTKQEGFVEITVFQT